LRGAPALAVAASQPAAQGGESLGRPGRVTEPLNVRSEPRVAADTLLHTLRPNDPVWVYEAVATTDGDLWYRVGDGEYTHAAEVRLPRPPPKHYAGRWIDADLREPALLTAYEDDRPVYSALMLYGETATETEQGEHRIGRRVQNETMDSAAIHYNYWSSNFGHAGTHGCLGLNLDDAKWFWDWASVGSVVNIHG
jgi:hypothetical protein